MAARGAHRWMHGTGKGLPVDACSSSCQWVAERVLVIPVQPTTTPWPPKTVVKLLAALFKKIFGQLGSKGVPLE